MKLTKTRLTAIDLFDRERIIGDFSQGVVVKMQQDGPDLLQGVADNVTIMERDGRYWYEPNGDVPYVIFFMQGIED